MKTLKIEITDVKSLEHAMCKALKESEDLTEAAGLVLYKVIKVTFKSLHAEPSFRDHELIYTFEAEMQEI